jgi:hypothetical protein
MHGPGYEPARASASQPNVKKAIFYLQWLIRKRVTLGPTVVRNEFIDGETRQRKRS